VSLLTEVLIIGGVALDLVGAAVLSHAHNAESIAEIRAEIGAEKSAVGENDAIATHAQLLAEKRFGFFTLTFGLTMYLVGLVLKSPEGPGPMAAVAAGVVVAGLIAAVLWTRIIGGRVRDQADKAERQSDGEELPEQ
jgi:type VI protein secretion system component VasK